MPRQQKSSRVALSCKHPVSSRSSQPYGADSVISNVQILAQFQRDLVPGLQRVVLASDLDLDHDALDPFDPPERVRQTGTTELLDRGAAPRVEPLVDVHHGAPLGPASQVLLGRDRTHEGDIREVFARDSATVDHDPEDRATPLGRVLAAVVTGAGEHAGRPRLHEAGGELGSRLRGLAGAVEPRARLEGVADTDEAAGESGHTGMGIEVMQLSTEQLAGNTLDGTRLNLGAWFIF